MTTYLSPNDPLLFSSPASAIRNGVSFTALTPEAMDRGSALAPTWHTWLAALESLIQARGWDRNDSRQRAAASTELWRERADLWPGPEAAQLAIEKFEKSPTKNVEAPTYGRAVYAEPQTDADRAALRRECGCTGPAHVSCQAERFLEQRDAAVSAQAKLLDSMRATAEREGLDVRDVEQRRDAACRMTDAQARELSRSIYIDGRPQ